MLTLVPGGMGGSETYARALTRELSGVRGFEVEALLPANGAGFSEGVPERIVTSIRGGLSTRERLTAVTTATLRGRSIRALMGDADVVHYPFTTVAPRPAKRQAFVQTLHDLQHLDLPQLFGRAELLYRRHFYESAARRADVVITISEFAKSRVVELLGIAPDRIQVAHLGVDASAFVAHHGPRENFVLYPARGWAHKNHARLLEAMLIARRQIPGLRLVLTGGGLDVLGDLPEWVEVRGLVSTEELHELYRSAAALVFPSLYEGFGLPPLEAMASGCPVAASNAGSIPEVVGDAAVLFDPRDPEAIGNGIVAAIDRGAELSRVGVVHAASFTWEKCRDRHLAAYTAAAAAH